MEHIRVRIVDGLPQRLERAADGYLSAFLIPKARRPEVLQFIENQPEHIIKRAKSFMEVLGYLPDGAQAKGAGAPYRHRDFIFFLR